MRICVVSVLLTVESIRSQFGKVIEIAFRNDFVMAEGEKKKKKKAGWFKLPAIAVVKTKPVFHFPLGQMWEA